MANHVPGSGWMSDEEWSRRKSAAGDAGRRNPSRPAGCWPGSGRRSACTARGPTSSSPVTGPSRTGPGLPTTEYAGRVWEVAAAAALGLTGFDEPNRCPTGYLGTVRLVDVHPATGCCAPWGERHAGVFTGCSLTVDRRSS